MPPQFKLLDMPPVKEFSWPRGRRHVGLVDSDCPRDIDVHPLVFSEVLNLSQNTSRRQATHSQLYVDMTTYQIHTQDGSDETCSHFQVVAWQTSDTRPQGATSSYSLCTTQSCCGSFASSKHSECARGIPAIGVLC